MLQLPQRQCDGDASGFRPGRRLGASLIEQPAAKFEYDVALFGAVHEMVGGKQAEAVVPQPDQGFSAADPAGVQCHQRLVVEQQVTGGEGVAQAACHPAAFGGFVPHATRPCRVGRKLVDRGSRQNDGSGEGLGTGGECGMRRSLAQRN